MKEEGGDEEKKDEDNTEGKIEEEKKSYEQDEALKIDLDKEASDKADQELE